MPPDNQSSKVEEASHNQRPAKWHTRSEGLCFKEHYAERGVNAEEDASKGGLKDSDNDDKDDDNEGDNAHDGAKMLTMTLVRDLSCPGDNWDQTTS
jgi:hypothetical protein